MQEGKMAKVTITFEDLPDGKVKVESTPRFEQMAKMIVMGQDATSAEGMALYAINQIRAEAKRAGPTRILLPRLVRR